MGTEIFREEYYPLAGDLMVPRRTSIAHVVSGSLV